MEPASAHLSAAIYFLIAALLGRCRGGPFLLWRVYNLSFTRWGLEGAICNPHAQAILGIPLCPICSAHKLHPNLLAPDVWMCCICSC